MPDRFANCDVVGVATAVVPPVSRPKLTELRAAMQPVPVEADDVEELQYAVNNLCRENY